MELSFVKETDGIIENSNIISKSIHPQVVSAPGELASVNNEQETHKFDHFSIRGCVAEFGKRETKLHWPLVNPHNHTSDECPKTVSPLFVKRFRRWNCQNCLHNITASKTVTGSGKITNIQNDQVKNDYHSLIGSATETSQPSAVETIASLSQQSKENFLQGRVVEKNSSIHGSNGECHPLCSDREVNELHPSNLIKEGITIPRGSKDRSYLGQNCMRQIFETEGEASKGGANTAVGSNIPEASILDKHTINIVSSKRKDNKLVQGVGNAEISNKMVASVSINVAVSDQTDDQGLSKTVESKQLDRIVVTDFRMPPADVAFRKGGICEATYTHMDFVNTMVDSPYNFVNPAGSVDRAQRKRVPKLRSLYEILRNEDLCKTEKVHISSGNAGAKSNDNGKEVIIVQGDVGASGNYNGKSDASNFEKETADDKSQSVSKNSERKPKRKKAVASDGEGLRLIHWFKRVPRKNKSRKGDAQSKQINSEVGKGKIAAVRDLDLNVEYCGDGDVQGIIEEKKQTMTADVEVIKPPHMPRGDGFPLSGHTISEHLLTYHSHSKTAHSKRSGFNKSKKGLRQDITTQENCEEKASFSRIQNKIPRIEDGVSSRTHRLKKHSFELCKKGIKKQISTRTSEQQDEDDIPMDIVELLAENQQQRRLMSGGMTDDLGSAHNLLVTMESIKCGNRCSMGDYGSTQNLMMTGIMKDGKMWGTGGSHGNIVSNEMYRNAALGESQPDFMEAIKNECGPKSYHSFRISKQNNQIDLNQEAPIDSFTGLEALSPSIGLSVSSNELCPNRSCSSQNVYRNGMELLALCTDHINRITPGRNSSSFSHNGSLASSNGAPGFQNFGLNFNSNDIHVEGTSKEVAYSAGYQMMLDLSGKRHLNCKDKDESSINEGGTSASKPFAGAVNGHHSNKMDSVDLYSNETISALTLLRLMDRAAYSGEPRCPLIHNESIISTQQSSGQGNEIVRAEVADKNTETAKTHRIIENADQGQQARISGIPSRPVARVGVLGPLLQKEIATSSNNRIPPFGFKASSGEQSSLETNAMEKGGVFHSATVAKTMNAGTSILSRDVISRRIDYSIGSLANPGCSLERENIVHHVDNENGTLPPLRSTYKMEVCVLNRNPADIAMPDDISEYM